jgi:hypothetical protein
VPRFEPRSLETEYKQTELCCLPFIFSILLISNSWRQCSSVGRMLAYLGKEWRFETLDGQVFFANKKVILGTIVWNFDHLLMWRLYQTYAMDQARPSAICLIRDGYCSLLSIWAHLNTLMLAQLRSVIDKSLYWTICLLFSMWQ